ncbi:MAG: ATP-binding protein [Candidatus Dormibacteraeota bacterium]|nr:ATP-binding protein [Candidatus Dormibacteraeota bacterium]
MNRIATRIVLALVLVAAVALGIVSLGVLGVSKSSFANLMLAQGESPQAARAVFDQSVSQVFLVAAAVALVASALVAALVARLITKPLKELELASRSLAAGDHGIRVPPRGSDELISVAASFNQMAASLESAELLRSQLIADFAHELRTPLTNLSGYLEAIDDGVMEASPEMLGSLREEVDRLTRLSTSLDVLADNPRGQRGLVDLNIAGVVQHAIELLSPSFRQRGIIVASELAAEMRASANPDHLTQVLHNLLSNAWRYTPEGGRVTVSAVRRGDGVVVSVANSGEPIPPAELPRLWERFYRREQSRSRASGGAGIGLAIVKQLVEAGGGTVGAESSEGLNRFWFKLPAGHQLDR